MMNGRNNNKIGFWLLVLAVVGTVLFPPITIISSFPKVEVSDVTFILLTIYSVGLNRIALVNVLIRYKWLFISLIVLIFTASISIIFNDRITQYRDWFEPLKYIKLSMLLAYVCLYFKGQEVNKIIKYTFFGILIFNLLHYFNVFCFNEYIEVFYAPKHHLDLFGLNSIGEPSTRRMLGTLGNPNNNAILFLLFVVYFLPKRASELGENDVYASIASIFVLACQSRTGLVILVLILLVYFILRRKNRKHIFYYIAIIGFGYMLLQLSGNVYLGSLTDLSLLESAKRGRFAQWNLIFNEMPGKWILGHGVNKAFLEERNIYAESEYLLILFRYGLIGLFSYASICLMFFKSSISSLTSKGGMMILGVLIIMIVSGITNSPFHVIKLSVFMVLIIGMGLNLTDEQKS